MVPRIELLVEKVFIGMRCTMSLSNDKTRSLWQQFMPRRMEIQHCVDSNFYDIQCYDAAYFSAFNATKEFVKWAAVEVSNVANIPTEMETLTLHDGMYAVFRHVGPASKGPEIFQFIVGTWLPQSSYELDNRPHFEIMGENYRPDDPDAEEEIWIPVRPR